MGVHAEPSPYRSISPSQIRTAAVSRLRYNPIERFSVPQLIHEPGPGGRRELLLAGRFGHPMRRRHFVQPEPGRQKIPKHPNLPVLYRGLLEDPSQLGYPGR